MFKALKGETLFITGSGDETRDFTFIDDSVRAIRIAGTEAGAIGGTFNVASGKETTIGELARKIVNICSSSSKIEYVPRRIWDTVGRRSADISAISALGYAPFPSAGMLLSSPKAYAQAGLNPEWKTAVEFTDAKIRESQ
jgi:UDP-glucose 4-epimerase